MVALVRCSAASSSTLDGSSSGFPRDAAIADAGKDNVLAPLAPNVWLVHAASGLGDVRVCLRVEDPIAQPNDNRIPATSYPGLAPGQAARLHASAVGSLTATLYDAHNLAVLEDVGPFSCATLMATKSAIAPPLGVVKVEVGPTVLALVGCPAHTSGDTARCGPLYTDEGGNLALIAVPVAKSYDSKAPMSAQVLNLSPTLAKLNLVRWSIGALPDQGCSIGVFFEGSAPVGAVAPTPATLLDAPGNLDTTGVSLCDTSMGRMSPIVAASFVEQQRATDPTSVPPEYFATAGNFVFTVVGEVGGVSPNQLQVLALSFGATH